MIAVYNDMIMNSDQMNLRAFMLTISTISYAFY